MIRKLGLLALAIAASIVVLAADGASQRGPQLEKRRALRASKEEARKFRRSRMDGQEVRKHVRRLAKELRWHKSLRSALAEGRKQKKPIVWIHALGDLKGPL